MKILHFIRGKANPDRANGVNQVIHGLAKYLSKEGHEVYVVGISPAMDSPRELIEREGFHVEVFKSFSSGALPRLKELCQKVDMVHLHGVWNHNNVVLGQYLRKIKCPYVITAHSGLADDRIRQSNYYLKLIYHKLFQKKLYDMATGVHSITREEISDISRHTDNKNIFFIPNGIDLKDIDYRYKKKDNNIIRVGYLGRLSVEKNIENLIAAIDELPVKVRNRIKLYLIAPLDKNSLKFQKQVERLGLEDCVVFTGGLYGAEKINFLSGLDFYIHPAYSDVVSIAVMEAMAVGLPSVITRTSQVAYYFNSGAFIMVEPTKQELIRGIVDAVEGSERWEDMSHAARGLTENLFNWEQIAKQMNSQYKNSIERHKGLL